VNNVQLVNVYSVFEHNNEGISGILMITNYMFRPSGGHHQVLNKYLKRKQAKFLFKSTPAEAVGFFWCKNPQHAFLWRES
jgi:hypothetical protein